jgi:CheY-like chemotaxis protein
LANILLIDDDPDIRSYLSQMIEEKGHEVVEAADGAIALEAFKTTSVDLVVTDIFMPEKEGLETIAAIKKLAASTKILAMSGNPLAGYLDIAKSLGADATLRKPFSSARLFEAIDSLLPDTAG